MQLQQNQSDPTQPRLPKLKLKIAGPNNSNESLNKSGEMTMKRPEQRSPNSSPSAVSLEGKNVVKPIKISLVNKNNAPNQKPPNVLMRNPSQESNIAFSLGKQQQQQQARGGGEQNMTTKDQYDLKDAGMLTNLLLSHQFGQEQQQQQTLKKTHEPTHEEEIELGEIVRPKKAPGQSQQQQQQHQKQQQQQQNQQLLKKNKILGFFRKNKYKIKNNFFYFKIQLIFKIRLLSSVAMRRFSFLTFSNIPLFSVALRDKYGNTSSTGP